MNTKEACYLIRDLTFCLLYEEKRKKTKYMGNRERQGDTLKEKLGPKVYQLWEVQNQRARFPRGVVVWTAQAPTIAIKTTNAFDYLKYMRNTR